ncbi:hypothetical protein FACS189434_10830 [Bacteroidia bacterium]|nr:hypothetical protein FACS189434_10830 [Bacteroidia bacterium]
METIPTTDNIYGLVAIIVVTILVPFVKEWIVSLRQNRGKGRNAQLEKKLDAHIVSDTKNHADYKMGIKRLELLNLIQHNPTRRATIKKLFSEYKELGGNGYVEDVYNEWLEKQDNKTQ